MTFRWLALLQRSAAAILSAHCSFRAFLYTHGSSGSVLVLSVNYVNQGGLTVLQSPVWALFQAIMWSGVVAAGTLCSLNSCPCNRP